MRINDSVAALAAFLLWFCIAAAPSQADTLTPTADANVSESVVITYDPADGNLSVRGNGIAITTMELISGASRFNVDAIPPGVFMPPFDVATSSKLFHLNTGGFRDLDLGKSFAPGLSGDDLIADIEINGSILPAGSLSAAPGAGPYLYVVGVPEPASLTLFSVGMLLAIAGRRRRR